MQKIKREIKAELSCEPNWQYCQASFNSDGNITFRNFDKDYDKTHDELFVLSRKETQALFKLFQELNARNCDLPF